MLNDIFSFFEFEKVAVFTEPKEAWLHFSFWYNEDKQQFDINIKANDTAVAFSFWADYNWLHHFLEAVTDLLPLPENTDKYTGMLRQYSHCRLDDNDNGSHFYFNFKNIHSSVLILLRKDTTEEQEEEGVCYGLYDEFREEEMAAINKTILLKFSIVNNHLSYKLKEACDNLLLQIPIKEFKEKTGCDFPVKYYQRLVEYCALKPSGYP